VGGGCRRFENKNNKHGKHRWPFVYLLALNCYYFLCRSRRSLFKAGTTRLVTRGLLMSAVVFCRTEFGRRHRRRPDE